MSATISSTVTVRSVNLTPAWNSIPRLVRTRMNTTAVKLTRSATAPYITADRSSFAYVSARDRWPVILTGIIDTVFRAIGASTDNEKIDEGKVIVQSVAKLKYEVQHDRRLTPLVDDGRSDVQEYNDELEALNSPTWFNVPWLFAECYLYRRLNTFFARSKQWKTYDVFHQQKMSTFKSSRPAVLELAAKYKELIVGLEAGSLSSSSPEEVEKSERLLFTEMCEICLWGNATDLSLLTTLTYEDIQKLQGSEARKASEKNMLANDLPAVYGVLKEARESNKEMRRVDIVLDNAGFELYVDLILAGFLLSTGLATQIVLHPKSIPWFVSDVLPSDFGALLNALADPQKFYTTPSENDFLDEKRSEPLSEKEISELSFLFQHWSNFHQEGQLIIRPSLFWTSAASYWRLPAVGTAVYNDLKQSALVIFKGDLNYRKLTGDASWSPTTPFSTAIGPLGPGSGIRTLALRTCKADVVVGLPEGEDERLRATQNNGGGGEADEGRKWAWSGKFAVAQFCDGKEVQRSGDRNGS